MRILQTGQNHTRLQNAAAALLTSGFFSIVYNSRDANGLRGFSYRACFFNPALGERPQGVGGEREKRKACAKKNCIV